MMVETSNCYVVRLWERVECDIARG